MGRKIASLLLILGTTPLHAAAILTEEKAPAASASLMQMPAALHLSIDPVKADGIRIPEPAPSSLSDASRAEALPSLAPDAAVDAGPAVSEDASPTIRAADAISPSHVDGISILAEARVRKIMAEAGAPLRQESISSGHGVDLLEIRGTPASVRPAPLRVLRHYTTAEGAASIRASGSIWNGVMPYTQTSRGLYRKDYLDLTGIFFTLPKVSGETVGVPKSSFSHYVDVELPAALPLLEVEAERIFLLPLPARARDWVKSAYEDWVRTGKSPSGYERMLEKIAQDGGPGPDLQVPVKIVGHGRAD